MHPALPIKSDFSDFYVSKNNEKAEVVDVNETLELFEKNLQAIQSISTGSKIQKKAVFVFKKDGTIEVKFKSKNSIKERVRRTLFNLGLIRNASRDIANMEKFSEFLVTYLKKHPPMDREKLEEMQTSLEKSFKVLKGVKYHYDSKTRKSNQNKDNIAALNTVITNLAKSHLILDQQKDMLDNTRLTQVVKEQITYFKQNIDNPKSATEFATWIRANQKDLLKMEPFQSKLAALDHLGQVDPSIHHNEEIRFLFMAEMIIRDKEIYLDEFDNNNNSALTPSQKGKMEDQLLEEHFPVTFSFVKIQEARESARKLAVRQKSRYYRQRNAALVVGVGSLAAGTALLIGGIVLAIVTRGGELRYGAMAVVSGSRLAFNGLSDIKKVLSDQGVDESSLNCFENLLKKFKDNPNQVRNQILALYDQSQQEGDALINALTALQGYI